MLFSGTVTPDGNTQQLVGAVNKNGIFYVWNRTDLAAGPVARVTVANPQAGDIAPAAYDGTYVYMGTRGITINGTKYQGSILALDPDNLAAGPVWRKTLSAAVYASATAGSGVVVIGAGHKIYVLNSADGTVLTTVQTQLVGSTRGTLYGAAAIANGVLYEADTQGFVYALSPGGT